MIRQSGRRKVRMKSAVLMICSRDPIKPVYTPSKVRPRLCQWAVTGSIWSVRSRKVLAAKPPVWVDK